jgi:hypothetical protein
VGEEHPAHPRVPLAKNLAGPLHGHLTHQGHGEDFELLDELRSATLLRRGDTVDHAIVATVSSLQRTDVYALLVEDVEVPLLHWLDMMVAAHRNPGTGTILGPQPGPPFDLQYET